MLGTHQISRPWHHAVMADKTHKWLAAHRKAHGLTSEQLARELGTSKPTISRLENHGAGGAKKTLDWWLARIAEFYKVPVDRLNEPPEGNEVLGDGAEIGRTRDKIGEEPMEEAMTVDLMRVLETYGYRRATNKLAELEAKRQRPAAAGPPLRRRMS